jgi:hypothetical protein
MRSNCHSFPSDGCDALWRSGPGLYTWPVRKLWWSPAASPASPSPTPQNSRHRQTNRTKWISIYIYELRTSQIVKCQRNIIILK